MRAGNVLRAIVVVLALATPARAQELPPSDVLSAILPQIQKKLPATSFAFRAAPAHALTDDTCRMQRVGLTTSYGLDTRTFSLLVDHQAETAIKPTELLARVSRITVDADGAVRAYHPDDPYGEGLCTIVPQAGAAPRLDGVCALDAFSSAGIRLFSGSQEALKPDPRNPVTFASPDFAAEWTNVWPLIRDRQLKPIDLAAIAGSAVPQGVYMFYWKERRLSVFLSREIIAVDHDGYPCLHGPESRYSGYFVAGTTLTQRGPVRPDGCAPAHYLDAERIPFFVLPGPTFGHISVGDIVIGQLTFGLQKRIVFGIVGDTGPFDQIGEGSIAFVQGLLGRSDVVMNSRSLYSVDIDLAAMEKAQGLQGTLAILVLGGTKPFLGGDYSRENIERVGRREFARWSGGAADDTRRLDACIAQAEVNPLLK